MSNNANGLYLPSFKNKLQLLLFSKIKISFFYACLKITILLIVSMISKLSLSQDNRAQLGALLSRGYVNANFGYINYPYGNEHLGVGFIAEKIEVPHFAARIILGCQLNKYLALQYSIMRPAIWPSYQFKDGNDYQHLSVWINEWGLTLKGKLPVTKKDAFFLECGLGLLSRNGFEANSGAIIKDANYLTFLSAVGYQHTFSNRFDGIIGATYSIKDKAHNQPYTFFASAGVVFHMRPLKDSVAKVNAHTPYFFPLQMLQIGGTSHKIGYEANDLFSMSGRFNKIPPIFWRGVVQTNYAFAFNYQRNIFHTYKAFSFDIGTSYSFCKTKKNNNEFFAISVFPLLRFYLLRTKPLDFYFNYSVVGPTFISKVFLDDRNTGGHFTFQDFLGIGTFIGKNRKLNAEIKIEHYSNGNNYAQNPGIDIPLMLNVGYSF